MVNDKVLSKILLVVDDNPSVLKVIKEQLEQEGYAVITEKTGQGVEETVQYTKLMAVLLDLGLPDADGFDILQKIKTMKPSLPVIIVTGRHEESEARRAFELGAWDYVTKPIDFKYLKNLLSLQSPS